jgi:hypothetical protein
LVAPVVVPLAVDAAALAVLHMLDARALAPAEPAAVGAAAHLISGDPPFLALEPIGLARIQLAAHGAMGDARLCWRGNGRNAERSCEKHGDTHVVSPRAPKGRGFGVRRGEVFRSVEGG